MKFATLCNVFSNYSSSRLQVHNLLIMDKKTYEVLPAAGESHAHIMNLLPCDVNVKIFNNSGYDNSFKIAAKMNEIVKDLEVGKYTFEVNTNEDCSGNLSVFS